MVVAVRLPMRKLRMRYLSQTASPSETVDSLSNAQSPALSLFNGRVDLFEEMRTYVSTAQQSRSGSSLDAQHAALARWA